MTEPYLDRNLRIDLHTHTFLSDGVLLPSEQLRRAVVKGYGAIAITDHADASNLDELPRLIEYAASLKIDTLLLSDLDVYESLEDDYLKKVGAQAKQAGIELQAGTASICPTSKSYNEKKWGKAEDHARLLIRTAKNLGTSVARCYMGSRRDRDMALRQARAAARGHSPQGRERELA